MNNIKNKAVVDAMAGVKIVVGNPLPDFVKIVTSVSVTENFLIKLHADFEVDEARSAEEWKLKYVEPDDEMIEEYTPGVFFKFIDMPNEKPFSLGLQTSSKDCEPNKILLVGCKIGKYELTLTFQVCALDKTVAELKPPKISRDELLRQRYASLFTRYQRREPV